MMLIDTHCHLDFPEFNHDRKEAIERAALSNVGYIINVASSLEGSRNSVKLAKEYSSIYASVGIHPHYADEVKGNVPHEIKKLAKEKKVVAIGEVGLDYYRNLSSKKLQKKLFLEFLDLANDFSLPIIIHSRDAHQDTLDILTANSAKLKTKLKGVMHCFSADEEYLKKYLDLGLYISFTGNITFKNARALRKVVEKVPVEKLLLETDAPFLAPQELRGKRNEPAYLTYLIKELSGIYGLSIDDIARITTHNAKTLFNLPIDESTKIAYPIRDSLYLNITNECTNDCNFCVRRGSDFVKGHKLKLDKEPTVEEIMKAISKQGTFKKIVFCGYGEPTLRLDIIKKIAKALKEKGVCIRLVTNGEANLIHKRPIARELVDFVDKVSISLNVHNSELYDKICRSKFGPGTFDKVKQFAKECLDAGIEVELTFLDLDGVDSKACEKIANNELKVNFRMRHLGTVG